MKRMGILIMVVLLGSPAFATTKTVGKSGASFTSIQAAVNSFTEAEVTDGVADVVEIIDGAEYDEQVMIGGLIPNPDSQANGYLNGVIALAKNRDPFTLRGADPNNRPKINPVNVAATAYGVFTNDPGDNFVASFSFMGKDITVQNVQIIQSSELSEQYCMNGQAGNMVFENVLFAHEGEISPGEDLINLNNAHDIAAEGFDNSYTFVDCTFDGTFLDMRNSNSMFYFHGYSAGDAAADGVNLDDIPVRVTFDGCSFINNETATNIRGRDQANHLIVKNCYLTGNAHGIRATGRGSVTIENSIFYQNQNMIDDASKDFGAVEIGERNSHTPALVLKNSLFVDNLIEDFEFLEGTIGLDSRSAAVRFWNGNTNADFMIERCTFVNNPVALRFADTSARARKGTVDNCVFVNSNVAVLTGDDAGGGYLNSGLPAELLEISGSGNIFDGNNIVVEEPTLLPNVNITGSETTVVFENAAVNAGDPFAGPPFVIVSPSGAGADLTQASSIGDFMIYN
jgi:hypothetical protein